MIEFLEIQNSSWKNYKFKKIDFDERYIELMSMMFNKFIRQNKDRYIELNLNVPKFLQAPEFNVNPYFLDACR